MEEEKIVHNQDELRNILAERNEKAARREVNKHLIQEDEPVNAQHIAIANQIIKVIANLKLDPFIKKVMSARILWPVLHGEERSHLSIALELGATVDDVVQAEEAGIEIVGNLMQRFSVKEEVEKFNRDRAVQNTIKEEIEKTGTSS